MSSADDLYEKLREIRYETTAIQGKLTDVFSILETLHIQDAPRAACDRCGATFKGPLSLGEHVYRNHAGPVPSHWEEAEARTEPELPLCGSAGVAVCSYHECQEAGRCVRPRPELVGATGESASSPPLSSEPPSLPDG